MTRTASLALAAACLLGLAAGAAAQVGTPGLTGYVTLASDYRSRGLSLADGGGALQLGIDYRHDSGWFAGAWGANVDYASDAARPAPRRRELVYYTGYDRQQGPWGLTATLSRYTYPEAWLDYDYAELAGNVSYRDRAFVSIAYTDDYYGTGRRALTPELGLAWPVAWNTEIGAAVGRLHYDPAPGGGYTYWNLGASKVVRRVAIDLRYHDTSYEGRAYFGSGGAERWVLSVTYGIQSRR